VTEKTRTRRSNSDDLIEARAEITRLQAEVQRLRENTAATAAVMKMVGDTVIELRDKLRQAISP
jgi:uncharacterized membrane protein YdfJ with MMPL/SSD domain